MYVWGATVQRKNTDLIMLTDVYLINNLKNCNSENECGICTVILVMCIQVLWMWPVYINKIRS